MSAVEIRVVQPADVTETQFFPLVEASTGENFGFIEKLWEEYQSQTNRFDQPGAVLLGAYQGDRLMAVAGVQPDPYLNQPNIGRIRHVYVLPAYRRMGIGRLLIEALIDHSRGRFETLTLRTRTAHGDAFYKALGFTSQPRFSEATHWIDLQTGK